MFVSIMIVLIVLSNFLTIVYARERLLMYDIGIMMKKAGIKFDLTTINLVKVIVRLLFAIFIFLFWLYSLVFIPFLRLPIILNIITGTITLIMIGRIDRKNPDLSQTFTKRLWLTRIDAIVSLIIWFPYFSPLLVLVF